MVRAGSGELHPVDYYRQYYGIQHNGRRMLMINGFHKSFVERSTSAGRAPDFWRDAPTGEANGGCRFFHAVYDMDARKFLGVVCQRDPIYDDMR